MRFMGASGSWCRTAYHRQPLARGEGGRQLRERGHDATEIMSGNKDEGNSRDPESLFELCEEEGIGEATNESFSSGPPIVQRELPRIPLHPQNRGLYLDPELAAEPRPLGFVVRDSFLELGFSFRMEDDGLHG